MCGGFGLWVLGWEARCCIRDVSGTRGEARAVSVVSRGCRGAFPSSPRCSGTLLGLITALCLRDACVQLGSEGLGAALAINPP